MNYITVNSNIIRARECLPPIEITDRFLLYGFESTLLFHYVYFYPAVHPQTRQPENLFSYISPYLLQSLLKMYNLFATSNM